jgi:hypothetical protein
MNNKEMPPEEKLLHALFDNLTEQEAKYLNWLSPRINQCSLSGKQYAEKGKFSVEKARELFKKKFPDTKWMLG